MKRNLEKIVALLRKAVHQTVCLNVAIFSWAGSPGYAETATPAPTPQTDVPAANSAPKIHFGGLVYDFGKVDSGTLIKHDFVFTNAGNQTLEITGVRFACGCTTAGAWDEHVEPGKTGRIPVQFNSRGMSGPVSKTVTVTCNDPAHTNITLQVKGILWKPIEMKPAFAVFKAGSDETANQTQTLRILNNLEEPVTLSEPVCTNKAFKAEIKTVKEGKEFEVTVTALAPFYSSNRWAGIFVKTSTPRVPELTVNCYLTVLPAITVSPSSIMLPAGPLTNAPKYTVTIQNNTTNLLSLTEPSMSVAGVDLQLTEVKTGRVFRVTATFPQGFKNDSGRSIEATFKSSNPKHPVVKIPVFQTPGPSTATEPASASPEAKGAEHQTSAAVPAAVSTAQKTARNKQAPLVSHKTVESH